jgi:5-methylcytosine-specific restriction protein B
LKETYDLKDYKKSKGLNYVLIIDEINRGNISKIFGELITLLEVDKRTDGDHTIKAKLPYSGEDFSVPSNLYIIGTMNTTDRSVGHIDYAIRRRFAFYTLAADELAIESYYSSLDADTKETALKLFAIVKDFLEDKISPDFDLEDVMVGHSYFMAKNKDGLKMKLEYEILPLIKEYEKDGIAYFMKEDLVDLKNRCLELF